MFSEVVIADIEDNVLVSEGDDSGSGVVTGVSVAVIEL